MSYFWLSAPRSESVDFFVAERLERVENGDVDDEDEEEEDDE